MKNFVEQVPKNRRFLRIVLKMNLVQIVLSTSTPNYRWKFVYRPIFKRSNIGRPIYRL